MILNQKIILQPNPYTKTDTDEIIYPEPIVLDNPEFTFEEIAPAKLIIAKCKNLPFHIAVIKGEEYTKLNNSWTEELAFQKLLEIFNNDPQTYLQGLMPKTLESSPYGAGTILSNMLSMIGIKSNPNCMCRQRAIYMNEQGPDWCEQNINLIMKWLKEEAEKRKLPFIETVAKLLVNRAISIARKHNVK